MSLCIHLFIYLFIDIAITILIIITTIISTIIMQCSFVTNLQTKQTLGCDLMWSSTSFSWIRFLRRNAHAQLFEIIWLAPFKP